MYGMVNRAVEDMVRTHHGEAAWDWVKTAAGVDVEVFFSNESYPDALTYRLVEAASAVLGLPAAGVLEAFGEHWVLHIASEGYGGLMKAAGRSLPEFLANLPNFHSRVAMMFPKLQPPRFRTSEVTANSLHLHYFTERPGLTHFVIGLMQGLGKLYHTPAKVSLLEAKDAGADHDIFLVAWEPPPAA